jgi:hypothetical protein
MVTPLRRRPIAIVALLTVLAVAVTGCAGAGGGHLLLAEVPGDAQAAGDTLAVWAVDPGEEVSDANRVSTEVAGVRDIETRTDHGEVWSNRFGREWHGSVLLSFTDGEQSLLTVGDPGEEPTVLAGAPQLQATVVRRGVFVRTSDGCALARGPESVSRVGDGSCTISQDERWVMSWQRSGEGDPGGLVIRDLRRDTTVELDDLSVLGVTAAENGRRLFVVLQEEDGAQGVVIDADDGEEIARTDVYAQIDAASITAGPDGFAVLVADQVGTQLLHVDHDGAVEPIDSGDVLIPIAHDDHLVYLRYQQDLAGSSLRSWSQGHDPSVLLEGYVGAGSAGDHGLVATRETAEGTEFWRPDISGERMTRALTLPRGPGATGPAGGGSGVQVQRMVVRGDTAHMLIVDDSGGSYVRIDLHGDHSDAPVRNVAGLVFDALDADGTALLTETVADGDQFSERILAIRPDAHGPDVRAELQRSARKLIHEGRIYFTDISDENRVTVNEVRSSGSDRRVRELYVDKQIGGSTWPEDGGAVRGFVITPLLLLQQQQQLQQQQAQAGA